MMILAVFGVLYTFISIIYFSKEIWYVVIEIIDNITLSGILTSQLARCAHLCLDILNIVFIR